MVKAEDFLPDAPHDGTPIRFWVLYCPPEGCVVRWGRCGYEWVGGEQVWIDWWYSVEGVAFWDPKLVERWEIVDA